MLRMAWQSIRTRPSMFAGAFVASALGVMLVAAAVMVMTAEPNAGRVSRYRSDTVVVTVPSRATPATGRLGGTAGVSADLVGRLARLSDVDTVVADRVVEPRLAGGRQVPDT